MRSREPLRFTLERASASALPGTTSGSAATSAAVPCSCLLDGDAPTRRAAGAGDALDDTTFLPVSGVAGREDGPAAGERSAAPERDTGRAFAAAATAAAFASEDSCSLRGWPARVTPHVHTHTPRQRYDSTHENTMSSAKHPTSNHFGGCALAHTIATDAATAGCAGAHALGHDAGGAAHHHRLGRQVGTAQHRSRHKRTRHSCSDLTDNLCSIRHGCCHCRRCNTWRGTERAGE